VRPPDIARRFGLSEGVVHKIVQTQRAIQQTRMAHSNLGARREIRASNDVPKEEAS